VKDEIAGGTPGFSTMTAGSKSRSPSSTWHHAVIRRQVVVAALAARMPPE
jgi:hypothetical protein